MITLFHDYASPASAVAVLRLHRLLDDELPIRFVGYRPLPVEAPTPPTLQVLEELERHAELAAELGLHLRRPALVPPTTRTHAVEALAASERAERAFREQAYRALWERGEDVAATAVLVGIGTDVGLDPDAIRSRLDDAAELRATAARLSEARSVHVGDVPAVEFDGTLVSAFLPLSDLRQLAAL